MGATLTETDLRHQLKEVLAEIQDECARDSSGLCDETLPLEDLPGFDSLSCVDAEARLSERLGTEIDIPFKDPTSGKPLSVLQITELMVTPKTTRKARAE